MNGKKNDKNDEEVGNGNDDATPALLVFSFLTKLIVNQVSSSTPESRALRVSRLEYL